MFYKLIDTLDNLIGPFRRFVSFNTDMLLRNSHTDMDLDKKIVEYLDDPNITPVRVDKWRVILGDLELWGACVPYASFKNCRSSMGDDVPWQDRGLPSRSTVIRLLKALGEYPFDKPST